MEYWNIGIMELDSNRSPQSFHQSIIPSFRRLPSSVCLIPPSVFFFFFHLPSKISPVEHCLAHREQHQGHRVHGDLPVKESLRRCVAPIVDQQPDSPFRPDESDKD